MRRAKRKQPSSLLLVFVIVACAWFVLSQNLEKAPEPSQTQQTQSDTVKRLKEKDYQAMFAKTFPDARIEVVAANKTRCDILTDEYAIEVEFAHKWQEAIGQAFNYAAQFKKKPGIVLILERKNDRKYLERLKETIDSEQLPIKVWTIDADGNIAP